MNDHWVRGFALVATAALVVIWGAGLWTAYVQGERSAEPAPGTRRRIMGALLGLTFAPAPLFVPGLRDGTALLAAGTVVLTQQLAGALTFSGTLAAWRAAERREPPAAPPSAGPDWGDAGGAAG